MGVIIRQSIKGTIVNYVGVAIGFLTTFFVLTRCLTSEEIGLSRVLIDTAVMLSGLSQLGNGGALMRFFPYFKDESSKNHGIFFLSVVVPLVGFLLFSVLFLVFKRPICHAFAENAPLFVEYYYALFPLALAMLYMSVCDTNANILMRIAVPKFIREVGIRIGMLVLYILYALDLFPIKGFVIGLCLVYAIATLLNIGYLYSLHLVSLKADFKFFTKSLAKDYVLYSLFLILSALTGAITPYINTMFISSKMGLAFTGVFSIGVYVASVIEIPYRSLGTITQPQLSFAYKNRDTEKANRLCKDVSLHQFLISSLLFFTIWINIDLLFALLPNGQDYVAAKWVVLLLGLNKVIYTTVAIGTSVISYSKYYFLSLIFSLMTTVVAILLNNCLIPIYGLNGAAGATLCTTLIGYAVPLIIVYFLFKSNPFSRPQLKVLLVIALLFAANALWTHTLTPLTAPLFTHPILHRILDALVRTCTLLAVGTTAIYYWKASAQVNEIIRRVLRRGK